jgi:3-isopropylmalate/(R)-2-methylmalate dehydratase large subunit
MTLCNMSIEERRARRLRGPDETTFAYRGRRFAPKGTRSALVAWWRGIAATRTPFDDDVEIAAARSAPGARTRSAIGVAEKLPRVDELPDGDRSSAEEAYRFMGLVPGRPLAGTPIQVAFIGSCTNGRISDLREAARVASCGKVAPGVRALVVPGSEAVRVEAEREGLHEIFQSAGFQWREAGCSMCLAMNPDKSSAASCARRARTATSRAGKVARPAARS